MASSVDLAALQEAGVISASVSDWALAEVRRLAADEEKYATTGRALAAL